MIGLLIYWAAYLKTTKNKNKVHNKGRNVYLQLGFLEKFCLKCNWECLFLVGENTCKYLLPPKSFSKWWVWLFYCWVSSILLWSNLPMASKKGHSRSYNTNFMPKCNFYFIESFCDSFTLRPSDRYYGQLLSLFF